jgi:hypothetical protein
MYVLVASICPLSSVGYEVLTFLFLGTNGLRELCDGLQSGWEISTVGTMGYGRTGRL